MKKSMKKSRKNNKKSYKRHKLNRKRSRNTRRKFKGGSIGSDIRQNLVTLCRRNNFTEYQALTREIINKSEQRRDFFYHLSNQIHTFNPNTLECLRQCLLQIKQSGMPDSIPYLYYIFCKKNEMDEYEALTREIITKSEQRRNFFHYLNNQIHTFNPNILECLKDCLFQIKRSGTPDAIVYLYYIFCMKNEWDEYEALTQEILKDYRNGNQDFLIYLDNNIQKIIGYDENRNPIFEFAHLFPCLLTSVTRLQEEAIAESMKHVTFLRQQIKSRQL